MVRSHVAFLIALAGSVAAAPAQTLLDPCFETYFVPSGGFVKPLTGVWTFTNDAGVVEPISPNSSTAVLNTWSATRAAFEGAQYASTYAGADSITQRVAFAAPGDYVLSVRAFGPSGTLTIPGDFTNQPVTDGAFVFRLGAAVGPEWTVRAGQDWATYSTTANVPAAGTYDVGVVNTQIASYFINYDAFQVRPVPEPASLGVLAAGSRRRRRSS